MKKEIKAIRVESLALMLILLAAMGSGFFLFQQSFQQRSLLKEQAWLQPERTHHSRAQDYQAIETATRLAEAAIRTEYTGSGLFVGELRVIAIGSHYPIPYAAEVCPFTGAPQPAMNQLDRDGDGMTDDWELKYALNKYDSTDAVADADADGFSNLEEFHANTNPEKANSHPPYATKLRFVRRIEMPFPLIFQGVSQLPDGRMVFQLNTPADGKSHFREIGESIEKLVVEAFRPRTDLKDDRLVIRKGGVEVTLPRGEVIVDPESPVELINILDHTKKLVTMGALFSLRNDYYTVVGVESNKVSVQQHETGRVIDVVGYSVEKQ
jgi:hypothetical protein